MSKNTLLIQSFLFMIFAITNPVHAENPTIIGHASSFNPVGSGARAIGQGGAFIAVADDATAASWNPTGLYILQIPEISVVGNYLDRLEDNRFGKNPEADGPTNINDSDLNYASAAYPFHALGRNMVFSLNWQQLYDFNREWRFQIKDGTSVWERNETVYYVQKGSLSALGLAFCVAISPNLSVGATVNIWNNDISPNQWEEEYHSSGNIRFVPIFQNNASLGACRRTDVVIIWPRQKKEEGFRLGTI